MTIKWDNKLKSDMCVSGMKIWMKDEIFNSGMLLYVCNQGCELKINIFEERDIDTN